MRIAIGSDEKTALTDFIVAELQRRGHEPSCFGPMSGNPLSWPKVAEEVAQAVRSEACDQGILLCWTGTGVSIAANKVPGIRAALCVDAYTASGARKWNDANVLALSLRTTSEPIAKEILDQWFSPVTLQPDDLQCVSHVRQIEDAYSLAE
jgi:ribose 5-phosphate isomerase B